MDREPLRLSERTSGPRLIVGLLHASCLSSSAGSRGRMRLQAFMWTSVCADGAAVPRPGARRMAAMPGD
jgi:hypothetical protein